MPREFQGSTVIAAGEKITMSQLPIRLRRHPEFAALRPLLVWAIKHYIEPIRMGVEMEVDWEVDQPFDLVEASDEDIETGAIPERSLSIHYSFRGEGIIIQHGVVGLDRNDMVTENNGIVVRHWISSDLELRNEPIHTPSIYAGPHATAFNAAWYEHVCDIREWLDGSGKKEDWPGPWNADAWFAPREAEAPVEAAPQ